MSSSAGWQEWLTSERRNEIPFCTAKELAQGNRRRAAPRWSAPPELHLMCDVTKLAKKKTRAERELVSVHAQRALHTPCSAHHSNGTLIDKRSRQRGMLGTRLIHFLCPWWKSLFAAMVSEEGGRTLELLQAMHKSLEKAKPVTEAN